MCGIPHDQRVSAPTSGLMEHRDLLAGFARLHILHHAVEGEVFRHRMIEELDRHGYKLSAGTFYPMLHMMERRGCLVSSRRRIGRTFRRVYQATSRGREALVIAQTRVRGLVGEIRAADEPNAATLT